MSYRAIRIMLLIVLLSLAVTGCGTMGGQGQGTKSQPVAAPPNAPAKQKGQVASMVFVKKDTDGTGNAFEQIVKVMEKEGVRFFRTGSQGGMIGPTDVVLLKINCQWDERGGTNTDLVKSVISAILKHPDGWRGEVIVADNGQSQFGAAGAGGRMDWENNNALDRSQSIQRVVDSFERSGKVSAVLWDKFTTKQVKEYSDGDTEDGFVVAREKASTGAQVSYAKFRTRYGTHISFKIGVWDPQTNKYDSDRLRVINMPVLKTHGGYQVTAAVKSYMGTTSDKLTNRDSHNAIGRGFMGTQMAQTRYPVLNVLDAIWVNPNRGPRTPYNQAVKKAIVAVSTDPVGLDIWAARQVLMPAASEAGNRNVQSLDPAGKEPGTFGYWLRLSANELVAAGFPVALDESQIKVFTVE